MWFTYSTVINLYVLV